MRVIGDIARLGAKRQPEKTALVMGEERLAYRELNERVNRLANGLIARGIGPGDRVGILAENSIDFVAVVLAVAKTGAALVPMNFRYSGDEIAYVVGNCAPRVIFTGGGYTAKMLDATAGPGARPDVIPMTAECEGRERTTPMSALMSGQRSEEPARVVSPEAPAMVMYTSGTTGFPKGVLFSHAAYLANHQVIALEGDLERDDVALVPLPLFHNGGLNVVVLPSLMLGATVVLLGKGFTPVAMLRAIERHRATLAMWVPTMISMLVNSEEAAACDCGSLGKIWYGSSPISPPVLAAARERFKARFYQYYGMTEIGMTSILRPEDHLHRAHCTGREMFSADMRVVDDEGRDVAPGGIGEIISASRPLGMIGYYGNEAATREAVCDGWIRTGDLARVEDEGYFTIVDRKKDMIISGAENIYPKEIENALAEHPAVLDAAAFGIPDPVYGEAVCAAVVLRPGHHADAGTLIAFCGERIARYKKPRQIEFLPELPRNAGGKVLKHMLRAPHWDGQTRKV